MTAEGTTFVSFRRIRYHLASLAYRDLMLSGVLPWLSDHCIKTTEALDFVDNPHRLQPFLEDVIGESEFALALVDPGYLESPWTVLEFEHIVRKKLKTHAVLLDGASLPLEWQQNHAVETHTSIESALTAICSAMNKTLVPFAGHELTSTWRDQFSEYSFQRPSWITANPTMGNWLSDFGDYIWFHIAPVTSEPGLRIAGASGDMPPHSASVLYDLYETELWHQVRRIASSEGELSQQIGYHKLDVPALRATAIALSIQLVDGVGFCRYASVTAPGRSTRIEMLCFVKGSLQRFHTVVPEIDRLVTSLEASDASIPIVTQTEWYTDQARLADFLWVRCANCKRRVVDMLTRCCPNCRAEEVECLTVHCLKRRRTKFAELAAEMTRENQQLRRWGGVSQGVYDLSALCEGCLSSLYIPGRLVPALLVRPAHGVAVVWSPRTALLQWWLAVCLYGFVWGGGSIHGWLMGAFAIITVIEPYSPGARTEPISLYHRIAHVPTILPALVCAAAVRDSMPNQPGYQSLCALSAGLLLVCILARAVGTLKRLRTA